MIAVIKGEFTFLSALLKGICLSWKKANSRLNLNRK
jgi:hypothetical protein